MQREEDESSTEASKVQCRGFIEPKSHEAIVHVYSARGTISIV